jgi:hypothetical protein
MKKFADVRGRARSATHRADEAALACLGVGWPSGGARALLELARRLDVPNREAQARVAEALERELGSDVCGAGAGATYM